MLISPRRVAGKRMTVLFPALSMAVTCTPLTSSGFKDTLQEYLFPVTTAGTATVLNALWFSQVTLWMPESASPIIPCSETCELLNVPGCGDVKAIVGAVLSNFTITRAVAGWPAASAIDGGGLDFRQGAAHLDGDEVFDHSHLLGDVFRRAVH